VKQLKAVLAIIMMGLLALLPLRWAQGLGRRLGRRIYRRGDDDRTCRITRTNITLCFPELREAQREQLVKASLEETGCALAEMGVSWIWRPSRVLQKVKRVVGEEAIAERLNAGKGILLIAPHLGNWEVMNLYLSQRYPVTAMYKPPQLKLLDLLIRKMRARLGSKMAPADAGGIRLVLKALRRGEVVGILPDQEPERAGGVFAPFFGIDTLTMKLFPQLAAQTGMAVFCGYALRLPDAQGYELRFSPADEAINSRDLAVAAAAMNRAIERCVREAPAQYQWEYKRFNTRPEGAPKLYRR